VEKILKQRLLFAAPGILTLLVIVTSDLMIVPLLASIPEKYETILFPGDNSSENQQSEVTVETTNIIVEDENDENPFKPLVEYFSFTLPIAGTFFDDERNYSFNVSIKTELSPVVTNPFDTELDYLTTILQPIAVNETIGMKSTDLFSEMFRDKLGRILTTSFNSQLSNSGYDKIVSGVEIVDFWAP
jgi:hypothetical protein